MEIRLANKRQHQIADLLWEAKTIQEAKFIAENNGADGLVAFNMMLATVYDSVMDTDIAQEVLQEIMR